jgi:tRNA A37 methylthiotransferase MiaB
VEGVRKYVITKLHAFPFSAHEKWESVPAAKLPEQIPFSDRKKRNSELMLVGDHVRNEFLLKNKWKKHIVLVEWKQRGKIHAWTENYIQVELDGEYKKGDLVEVML